MLNVSPGSFRALLQRFLHVSGTDLSGLSAPDSSSCPHASASATRILSSTLLDPSLEQDTKWDCVFSKVKRLVSQSCLTLCNLMDCSSPDSSVHGIPQAKVLEWVAVSFSRGSSGPGIASRSPALQADSLPSEPPVETPRQYAIL